MTAVRYNSRTALSIDTETCPKHSVRRYYTEGLDRIRLRLERNKLISDCELIRSRRATLQEIKSYYVHTDVLPGVFHRETFSKEFDTGPIFWESAPMQLSELPCGCFEDGPTRKYIPVDVLRAAGCVIDMAYRVGTGKHKNGLVFFPELERNFEMDIGEFQLSSVAIAAKQMKEKLNMKRILIFQWNALHCTQRATYDDKAILYISILDNNQMHYNQGHDKSHECGSRNAEGFNVNIVIDRLGKAEEMRSMLRQTDRLAAFRNIVMPIAREFNPEIVFALGGYDVINSSEYFGPMTSELMSLANGKVVILLANEKRGLFWQCEAAKMCLKALLGEEITPSNEDQLKERWFADDYKSLERTIQIQLKYWPCLQKYLSEIQNLLADAREEDALYEELKRTLERGRVSSLPGGKPKPSMVSSTDVRTTHDASDKYDPIVKGPISNLEHEETSSVETKNKSEIL